MQQRKRRVPHVIRPYLTTKEVLELSDMSRKVLRSCVSEDVVTPRRDSTDSHYDQYTFAQLQDLSLVQAMRQSDVSMSDIAKLVNSPDDSLVKEAYLQTATAIRRNRRMLKSIVHFRRRIARFEPAGVRDGYYLRYLPERWMALLPAAVDLGGLIDADTFTSSLIALKDVVDVVGWSRSMVPAELTSYTADEAHSTSYVCIELASPPMPFITEGRIVDGGCYRVIDEECCSCDGESCAECARFGRVPTEEELSLWKHIAITGQTINRTVLMSEMVEPYATGMWSECTQAACGQKEHCDGRDKTACSKLAGDRAGNAAGNHPDNPASNGHDNHMGSKVGNCAGDAHAVERPIHKSHGEGAPPHLATVRPRLMPHEVRLPLGVTGCVLPAGVYLCRQNSYQQRDAAHQRMLGTIETIPHIPLTRERELELARTSHVDGRRHPDDRRPGPFVEPFAAPRDRGDPTMFGWFYPLDDAALRNLKLPVDMALAPEDGFCLVQADIPLRNNSSQTARQELQVLVDASAFANCFPTEKGAD